MIQFSDVSKVFQPGNENQVVAVNHVSLDVPDSEFLVITGRSGSGKTTLLNLAAGITSPTGGKVLLQGNDLWSLNDDRRSEIRSQKIGFIFQFPSLLPSLTALENVILPVVFNDKRNGRDPRSEATARARELLVTVGLSDKLNAYPRQLSAGQQQRVVIARALMNDPEVLMADEPTSNLDEGTEREIMELFSKIHAQLALTILLVTHTRELVHYGSRAIAMAEGKIL